MINIEIQKDHELFDQLITEYPSATVIEINSFGIETIVSVLIPLAAIIAPTLSPLLIKLIGDRNVSIKYDGIEVSGDYRHVKEIISQIQQGQNRNSSEDDSYD